jgi:hypothetical protein
MRINRRSAAIRYRAREPLRGNQGFPVNPSASVSFPRKAHAGGARPRSNPFTSFSKGSRTFSAGIGTCSEPISSPVNRNGVPRMVSSNIARMRAWAWPIFWRTDACKGHRWKIRPGTFGMGVEVKVDRRLKRDRVPRYQAARQGLPEATAPRTSSSPRQVPSSTAVEQSSSACAKRGCIRRDNYRSIRLSERTGELPLLGPRYSIVW